LNEAKWSTETWLTVNVSKTSPSQYTWYGGDALTTTGPSLIVPVGQWRLFYAATIATTSSATQIATSVSCTLSDVKSAETDKTMTISSRAGGPSGTWAVRAPASCSGNASCSSKTTYYLNILTIDTSTATIAIVAGSTDNGGVSVIRATSTLL
jgi:hypothetical protein